MKDRENTAGQLRQMSDEQLAAILRDTTQSLFKLKMLAQSDRLDVPSELKRHRRLIARCKTLQGERARNAAAR